MCPIPEPCPVCKDIDYSVDDIDPILTKKLSAPDVIFQKLSAFKLIKLLMIILLKIYEYDSKSLEDYVFTSKMSDLELIKSITNYLNISIDTEVQDIIQRHIKQ